MGSKLLPLVLCAVFVAAASTIGFPSPARAQESISAEQAEVLLADFSSATDPIGALIEFIEDDPQRFMGTSLGLVLGGSFYIAVGAAMRHYAVKQSNKAFGRFLVGWGIGGLIAGGIGTAAGISLGNTSSFNRQIEKNPFILLDMIDKGGDRGLENAEHYIQTDPYIRSATVDMTKNLNILFCELDRLDPNWR